MLILLALANHKRMIARSVRLKVQAESVNTKVSYRASSRESVLRVELTLAQIRILLINK